MYIVLSGGFKAAEIRIHRITESTTHTTYQSKTEKTKFEDNIVNAVSCFRGRGSSGKDGGEVDGLNQRRRLGSKSGRRGLGREKPRRASIYCICVEMSRSCDFRRKPQMVKQQMSFYDCRHRLANIVVQISKQRV